MTNVHPLRWIRTAVFGVKQDVFAEIGGVSRPRVSRYETGSDRPTFEFLQAVRAEALRQGKPFSGDWFFEIPDLSAEDLKPGDAEALAPADAEARP